MKSSKLIVSLCVLLALSQYRCAAVDQKPLHWYSVSFNNGNTLGVAYGSSFLDEAAFGKALEGSAYIELNDLTYFDQRQNPKDWSEWSIYEEPRIYINPKDVTSFQPMKDDPRKIAATAAAAAKK